uniref:Uncharacterized protein n=1 Tax=Anguilla anguilla TaxID=7936 RepID=A0A0E9PBB9_ANGAN
MGRTSQTSEHSGSQTQFGYMEIFRFPSLYEHGMPVFYTVSLLFGQ